MPMFQHRHYVAIAKTLGDLQASHRTARAFADMLSKDNPRFDYERFLHMAVMGMPNTKDVRTAEKQDLTTV